MLAADWMADATQPPRDVDGIAVAIAHPDDETIGRGALLTRLPWAQIVVVTNGSPADPLIARRKGFADCRSSAVARANELRAALKIAGIESHRVHGLDAIDGNVWRDWQFIVLCLIEFFEKSRITVLTHAHEGGHSDPDGVVHCVELAARLLRRDAPNHHRNALRPRGARGRRASGILRRRYRCRVTALAGPSIDEAPDVPRLHQPMQRAREVRSRD